LQVLSNRAALLDEQHSVMFSLLILFAAIKYAKQFLQKGCIPLQMLNYLNLVEEDLGV